MASTFEFIPIALIILIVIAPFLIYGYIWSIRKVYASRGFDKKAVFAILIGISFFGAIPISFLPFNGWVIGISVGRALIPIIVSI